MKLAEIQALMVEAIRWPTGVTAFLEQSDPKVRERFDTVFAQTSTFDRTERVQVYAEAYFWRLAGVILDQFPVTAWLCGPKRFHNFLTDFVLAHPSRSPDLRCYGATIPQALREHDLGIQRPHLASVADIEWAIIAAVDAKDEATIDATALSAIPLEDWPRLVFSPVATLSTLTCELDFAALHRSHEAGDPAPATAPATAGQTFAVWRAPTLDVYHRRLEPPEAIVLTELCQGQPFAALCEHAATTAGVDAAAVARWLRRWVDDGLLLSVGTQKRQHSSLPIA